MRQIFQTSGGELRWGWKPLLVFDTVSAATQRIIELVVIVIGFLSILWLTKGAIITRVQKGEQNVASHS